MWLGLAFENDLPTKNCHYHLGLGNLHRLDLEDVAIQNDKVGQFTGGNAAQFCLSATDQGRSHSESPDCFSHAQTLMWIPATRGRSITHLAGDGSMDAPQRVGVSHWAIGAKGQGHTRRQQISERISPTTSRSYRFFDHREIIRYVDGLHRSYDAQPPQPEH